jgi:uncharacterized protein (TIGR02996 family)
MPRDEDALLRAIDEGPHDDLPRLAYADWLDENGQPDRAEFIRVQCRIARLSPLDAEQVPLGVREAELLKHHEAAWTARARGPSKAAISGFQRGFPVVTLGGRDGPDTLPPGPLGGLRMGPLDEASRGESFWFSPQFARVASLEMPFDVSFIATQARALAESPHFSRLLALRLLAHRPRISLRRAWRDAFARLAGSGQLAGLRRLTLIDRDGDCDGLQALAGAAWFDGLRHLALSVNHVSSSGVEAVIRSDALSRLESLDLRSQGRSRTTYLFFEIVETPALAGLRYLRYSGTLAPNEIREVLGSAALARLRGLSLTRALDDETAIALAAFSFMGQLDYLDLPHNQIGPRGVRALANSPKLAGLRVLALTGCAVGDGGAREIAEGESMANLTALSLHGAEVGDAGAAALAASPILGDLLCLDLSHCEISDAGARALAASPTLSKLRLLYLVGNRRMTAAGFDALRQSSRFSLVNDPERPPPAGPREEAEPEDTYEVDAE